MRMLAIRRLVTADPLAVGTAGSALLASGPAGAAQSGAGDCIAHAPTTSGEYQIGYTAGCSGHDEPELDPASGLAGSAQDLTWTAVLPSDGAVPVSAVGPTFWWGGTVTDPNAGDTIKIHFFVASASQGWNTSQWATVSDLGGAAEVNATCPTYGVAFCSYPWFAVNKADDAFTYGADYPGTQFDYGQAAQFATTMQCGGPFGPDSTFCDTVLEPKPPIG